MGICQAPKFRWKFRIRHLRPRFPTCGPPQWRCARCASNCLAPGDLHQVVDEGGHPVEEGHLQGDHPDEAWTATVGVNEVDQVTEKDDEVIQELIKMEKNHLAASQAKKLLLSGADSTKKVETDLIMHIEESSQSVHSMKKKRALHSWGSARVLTLKSFSQPSFSE